MFDGHANLFYCYLLYFVVRHQLLFEIFGDQSSNTTPRIAQLEHGQKVSDEVGQQPLFSLPFLYCIALFTAKQDRRLEGKSAKRNIVHNLTRPGTFNIFHISISPSASAARLRSVWSSLFLAFAARL